MTTNYPASLDDDASMHQLVNDLNTTVDTAYTSPATTLNVVDASAFPATGGVIYVNNERGTYTGKTGNQLTGIAGLGNNHNAGVVVEQNIDAEYHNNVKDAIVALETKMGVTSSAVAGTVIKRIADLEATASPLAKIDATVAPTATDDTNAGYAVGSLWVDITADEAYRCVDATAAAAVWVNTSLELADLGNAATKDTGVGSGDVATGDHNHLGVYEPADATIVKDADIGVSVQGYDADTSKTDVAETRSAPIGMGNNNLIDIKTASFNVEYDNGNSGAADTVTFSNGQKQKITLTANTTLTITAPAAGDVGNYQLRLIQNAAGGSTVTWSGLSASRWLSSATAPAINAASNGETIISLFWDGANFTQSASNVGAA